MALQKMCIGEIYSRFEKNGLRIVAAKMVHLTQAQAEGFYAVHSARPFFKDLVSFMISGPVIMQVLEVDNAIAKNREIMYAAFAYKLGIGPMFTEGKDELGWVEQYYNVTDMPKYMTFAEFKKKGYFVVSTNPNRNKNVALRWFAEDRQKDTPDWGPRLNNQVDRKGLPTTTGKVEFIATSIKRFEEQGYVDEYLPAMHTYVPAWESWHSPQAKKDPLGMLSPHPRFSFHTMGDGKDSFMNDIKDHRVLVDGHYYWIMRMNSKDAEARGSKNGDLIRAFNDRGSVILCAQVGERLQPGTVHSYESCAEYNPLGKPGRSADRGGCVNILTPDRFMSKYASGMAPNSTQFEVEKWDGGIYETA